MQNGKNTGFAVIELRSEVEKLKALDFNKRSMGGRWIGVNQAEVLRKNNNRS